jgi:hypothetical protein
MGNVATVYKQPPTFDQTADETSDYSRGTKGQYASSDKKKVAEIMYAKEGFASKEVIPGQTVHSVFAGCAKKQGDKIALRWEDVEATAIAADGTIPPPLPRDEWVSSFSNLIVSSSSNIF